jgi:hypothetical protein
LPPARRGGDLVKECFWRSREAAARARQASSFPRLAHRIAAQFFGEDRASRSERRLHNAVTDYASQRAIDRPSPVTVSLLSSRFVLEQRCDSWWGAASYLCGVICPGVLPIWGIKHPSWRLAD